MINTTTFLDDVVKEKTWIRSVVPPKKTTAQELYTDNSTTSCRFSTIPVAKISNYITFYVRLCKREFSCNDIGNMVAILCQHQVGDKPLYTVNLNPEGHNCTLYTLNGCPETWTTPLVKAFFDAEKIDPDLARMAEEREEEFKVYMQISSLLISRLYVKDGGTLTTKFQNLPSAYTLLQSTMGLEVRYNLLTETFVKDIRGLLRTHSTRKPVMSIVLDTFITLSQAYDPKINYLNWACMVAFKYVNTCTARYIIQAMAQMRMSWKVFTDYTYDTTSQVELDTVGPIVMQLIDVPDNQRSPDWEKWARRSWSGMFSDDYFSKIRTYHMPMMMSVCIGVHKYLNKTRPSIPSFTDGEICPDYEDLGVRMATRTYQIPLGSVGTRARMELYRNTTQTTIDKEEVDKIFSALK